MTRPDSPAHRKIGAVLDHLAGLDTTGMSDDAVALGLHIVAMLDGPGPATTDTAAKDTPLGESTLSSDVLALLAAVRDALDVPLAHWEPADERARERILSARADAARIVVAGIIAEGHRIPWSTAYLAERTAATPITYTLWDSAEVCGRCGRRFDPADTRPDGQARHRDTAFCRRCVDLCHDSEDAFHKCPVCVPAGAETGGGRP